MQRKRFALGPSVVRSISQLQYQSRVRRVGSTLPTISAVGKVLQYDYTACQNYRESPAHGVRL